MKTATGSTNYDVDTNRPVILTTQFVIYHTVHFILTAQTHFPTLLRTIALACSTVPA